MPSLKLVLLFNLLTTPFLSPMGSYACPIDQALFQAAYSSPNQEIDLAQLSQTTQTPLSLLQEHVTQLQLIGYPFQKTASLSTYRLLEPPDKWCAEELIARLSLLPRPHPINWTPLLFQETTSTNDLIAREAQQGHPEGLLISAEKQTHGRGQHNRTWDSPPQGGLYCSLLLRPLWPADHAPRLTLLTSVALAQALETISSLPLQIKWPNDLYLHRRKLGGILIETEIHNSTIASAVIGFGLNVNRTAASFPPPLQSSATSLFLATGHHYRRADLLVAILTSFETTYSQPFSITYQAWKQRCSQAKSISNFSFI